MSGKSVFNLNENIAGALSYVLLWFSGIFIYVMERENKFVRFHALQSTVVFLLFTVLQAIVKIVPFFGGLVASVLGLLMFVVYVYMIYTAYKGQMFRIPIIGDVVWEQVNK